MWRIKPLDVATLTLNRVATIYKIAIKANPGKILKVPNIAWLLIEEETEKCILVDTGSSDDPKRDSQFHNPVEKTIKQQLDYALKKEGVEAESIDTVILTHLHWDHGYGVYKLPNAKVYVQRDELQYAVVPFTVHKGAYELNDTSKPPYFFKFFHQLKVIDGDRKFCSGIDLIKLPGHSPGSQGVLVQTRNGRYLITGDLCYNMNNYNEDIPTGVYLSLYDYYGSYAKIKNLGDDITLLCGHDYNSFDILKNS